jgi:hypothetical protein
MTKPQPVMKTIKGFLAAVLGSWMFIVDVVLMPPVAVVEYTASL